VLIPCSFWLWADSGPVREPAEGAIRPVTGAPVREDVMAFPPFANQRWPARKLKSCLTIMSPQIPHHDRSTLALV
jgi:hypothetical protein